jgi:hypothetical protein
VRRKDLLGKGFTSCRFDGRNEQHVGEHGEDFCEVVAR